MDRPRSAFYKAKTKRMYYGLGNYHKTPDKVFSFGVLTKREFRDPFGTKFGLCPKGLRLAEYATVIEVIMKQVI